MNNEELKKHLINLGINITKDQFEKLEIYKKILIDYNNHTNLTAIKDEFGINLKHFYDSLTLNKYIKPNDKILDIGTGAGFPGMVLAIFNPTCHFVLLDSNNKKITFLKYLNESLNLQNVEFINKRAEDYVREHFEEFDVVTTRAVADLRILVELSLPALKIDGNFYAMKANCQEELENSKETIKILNGKITNIEETILPIESSTRTIIEIKHINKTDKKYPRNYDKILKKAIEKK